MYQYLIHFVVQYEGEQTRKRSIRFLKVLHTHDTLRGPRTWIRDNDKVPGKSRKKDQPRSNLPIPQPPRRERNGLHRVRDVRREREKSILPDRGGPRIH